MEFKAGKLQSNADALSRLPLQNSERDASNTALLLETLDQSDSVVSVSSIRNWTNKDPVLAQVRDAVRSGSWKGIPDSPDTSPYKTRTTELSVQDDCLLWGNRVVIPEVGRKKVMRILHDGHPGASRIKALARGMVWWPRMDADLESVVQQCQPCQANRKAHQWRPSTHGNGPQSPGLDYTSIFHTSSQSPLQEILGKHKELFKDELGLLKGTLVKIHVNETATPLFFKPRAVPYAVREKTICWHPWGRVLANAYLQLARLRHTKASTATADYLLVSHRRQLFFKEQWRIC